MLWMWQCSDCAMKQEVSMKRCRGECHVMSRVFVRFASRAECSRAQRRRGAESRRRTDHATSSKHRAKRFGRLEQDAQRLELCARNAPEMYNCSWCYIQNELSLQDLICLQPCPWTTHNTVLLSRLQRESRRSTSSATSSRKLGCDKLKSSLLV